MSLKWSFQLSLRSWNVGSHILAGFIFTPRFRKGCGGGENRASLKEWFWFGILSPTFYEKAFSKRSLKYFRSPGSSTSVSFKIWKAFPPSIFRLALSPGWVAERHSSSSAAPVFDLAHAELQSLGLGLQTTSNSYMKVYLALSAKDVGDLFFFFCQRNKYMPFPEVAWGKATFLFFFLTCSFYSVSAWEVANYLPGLKGAATRFTASHGHYSRRKSRSGLPSRDANWNSLCLRVRANKLSNVVAGEEMLFAGSQLVKTYSLIVGR